MSIPDRTRFALPLVYPGEQLTGVAPPVLERAAKRCKVGDPTHRGLVRTSATLARYGVRSCLPPSARSLVEDALDVAEAWADDGATVADVRKARSDAFAAVVAIEKKTLDAARAARQRMDGKAHTGLDAHASSIISRYAVLGANHASGAGLMTLDGVDDPAVLASVPQQIAGAFAYAEAGFGPARSVDLRAKAWGQAEWEADRQGAPEGHPAAALALQIFHEYLGAFWKDRSDGHRLYLCDFAEWALGSTLS